MSPEKKSAFEGEYYWVCNTCEREFSTKETAVIHEMNNCEGPKDAARRKEETGRRDSRTQKRGGGTFRDRGEAAWRIAGARESAKENYEGSKANLIEVHIILFLSLTGGLFGVDRAYRGQLGLAILKFITFGGLFIWFVIDIWISAFNTVNSWDRYYENLEANSRGK